MMDASKNTLLTSEDGENLFSDSLTEVDKDVFSFAALEEETSGFEQILMEPEYMNNNVGGSLNFEAFDRLSLWKSYDVDSFPCKLEYDQMNLDDDAWGFSLTQGGDETKLRFQNEWWQGTDEGFLHENYSLQASCEELIYDAEPADKSSNLDYGANEESSPGNVSSDWQSSGFEGGDYRAEISDSSSTSVMLLESSYLRNPLFLDQMTVEELQEAFQRMFRRETLVTDKHWLKHRLLFGLENKVTIGNNLKLLKQDKISDGNERKSILSSTIASHGCESLMALTEVGETGFCFRAGALVNGRRTYKPRRRHNLEPLKHHICHNTKHEFSYSAEKVLHTGSYKQCHQQGLGSTSLICQGKSFEEACYQVPSDSPVQKRHFNTSFLGHNSEDCTDSRASVLNDNFEMELSSAEPDVDKDDCVTITTNQTSRKRRSHNNYWTKSEVIRLIQGVSQCGVGRWSCIKRLLFSSTHRTPIDLKDKWRNLSKASSSLKNGRKVEQRKRLGSTQLSEPILRRIRELVLSRPMEAKSKIKRAATLSTSITNHQLFVERKKLPSSP
ncbi:hypothetical protein HS088_TW07G00306 [Tripterygium wilfordii]|uniref:Uncharacterized protein n=1 Tax=Tripterygium wilfordii TaxID=458696 RepID=A0A7J7DEE6_TRIWF|nr:uncharacterized protein LOC120002757 isoform X2 [Tripterygium wilfordii]KAF5744727.1 hypothetical protein HS088_TW07G00306 [Tripterygium wilfordii]